MKIHKREAFKALLLIFRLFECVSLHNELGFLIPLKFNFYSKNDCNKNTNNKKDSVIVTNQIDDVIKKLKKKKRGNNKV